MNIELLIEQAESNFPYVEIQNIREQLMEEK
jgi:hypothetical protein